MNDEVQIAGRKCAICSGRLGSERDGCACPTCSAVTHHDCASAHVCTPRVVEAPSPARTRPRAIWLGPVLGAVVGVVTMPYVRACKEDDYLRERAARALRCTPERVTVERTDAFIKARGCHDEVEYFVSCMPLDRDGCLIESQSSSADVNDMIMERLGGR